MMPEALLSIAAVCGTLVLSQLSPGPDVFYVFRTSLAQGFRAGFAVAFGINLGFFIQSVVVCTAGAWAMEQGWGRWILPVAACWLLYLAWKIFPRHWGHREDELGGGTQVREPIAALIGKGFLCNILNPKCMLFILGITSEALHSHAALGWYTPALVGSLFIASLAGWALWSGLLQWPPLRRAYVRHTQGIDALFALILASFAVLLLLR